MNEGIRTLVDSDLREVTSTKTQTLGSVGRTADGRVYRYAKAGASDLAPGKLAVNSDLNADVTNKTIAASAAIGAKSVVIDAGGAIVADAYADGFLTINDATGEGITYAVSGNTGVAGAGEVTVSLKEPLKVAVTVDVSEATLKASPFSGLVISATDQADLPVGVPNVTITAAYYGWVQTQGECAVLADEAVTKGLALTTGTGVAGAVEAYDGVGEHIIGIASEALVDTEYRSAFLTIS